MGSLHIGKPYGRTQSAPVLKRKGSRHGVGKSQPSKSNNAGRIFIPTLFIGLRLGRKMHECSFCL